MWQRTKHKEICIQESEINYYYNYSQKQNDKNQPVAAHQCCVDKRIGHRIQN